MSTLKNFILSLILCMTLVLQPTNAKADVFGGDVVVLLQILTQAIEEVAKLQMIIQNGHDTLNLLREINEGSKSGLNLIHIVNPRFNAGAYGNLNNPQNVLNAIHDLYGQTPRNAADSELMDVQDQSVAEVISMNRDIYDYADQVDVERKNILDKAPDVSPQGAAKLQNQSLAILIGVMTQLLRTQSQMLKIMGQNMAMENRREKISSSQFIDNYQSLSNGFDALPKDVNLPSLKGGE